MGLDLDFAVRHSGRPPWALTRRDVARALLAVPSAQALVALPDLQRELTAAGNPLSVAFWRSAREILTRIEAGVATVGEVQRWLEASGTEPIMLTRSFFLWPAEDERGPVASEMYARLVAFLEERLAAGEIDPDALVAGDPEARRAYEELQERWLNTPLPDGRIPSEEVNDEQDRQFYAVWDEEEEFALSELRRLLEDLPEPPCPEEELRSAAARLRATLAAPGYPGTVLRACTGFGADGIPESDEELWLTVAAGLVAPATGLPGEADAARFIDGELSREDSILASLCAIQYTDWLAAVVALVRRGPGVLASPERLARFIADSEDGFAEADEPEDIEAIEKLFSVVTPLWAHLGIVDRSEVLTPLGWWGLPKALERAWSPG
ncbi:MAG: hypothetical protein IRY84_15450 [Thermobispora bispora]|uniref:hypothetical protein n=1 Tax=Thermobispora bispora TaxID=2006 RepID=UPI00197CEA18|nr:hypothetical protein [Thermobispora bispora]MBO2473925.1 hypothetical protein [Actinomycetales bacterium]MBX6169019.1 hypothetical protein [Thermobispora bispora]QSI49381.1 hypothetical protein CYL17_17230 [Thermobispora bispora]